MKKEQFIFGTSTSRSGGTLVSNILSAHKDILITKDFIHFFRHIYNKYNSINESFNQTKLVQEMCLRLKYRNKIILPSKKILRYFKNIKNYSDILNAINNFLLDENPKKKVIGETANTEWRNIKNLLNLNENYKAFQVIRDPRAILSSWKKLTYSKGFKYLNVIFLWIDAVNYSENYLKQYNEERYLRIKFENIHTFPESSVKKLCQFAQVKFDPNMMQTEKWPQLLNTKYNYVNVSSYNNKQIYGFSKNRISQWKNHLEEWEVVLIQYLLKDYLKKLNYEFIDCNQNLLSKGQKIIENDEILTESFLRFKKTNEGTNKLLNDPSKPENWSATDFSKNISAKFIDTEDYQNYISEMKKIQKGV